MNGRKLETKYNQNRKIKTIVFLIQKLPLLIAYCIPLIFPIFAYK